MSLEKGTIVLDYIVEERIGKGSYATVYRVSEKQNPNAFYALKAVDTTSLSKKMLYNLDQEISIHKKLLHHNIVRLIASEKTPLGYNIVLEYCLTDLSFFIKRKQYPVAASDVPSLSFQEANGLQHTVIQVILGQIGNALAFCHQSHIIHRDLKPQNILINPFTAMTEEYPVLEEHSVDFQDQSIAFKYMPLVKIADFGFAAIRVEDMADTVCGSPLYMAPEILKYESYDYKVDLWSLGIILFECYTGQVPYMATNHLELLKIMNKQPVLDMDAIPKGMKQVVDKLLTMNPRERMDIDQLMHHPAMTQCQSIFPVELNEPPRQRTRMYHRRTSSAFSFSSSSLKSEPIHMGSYKLYFQSPGSVKTGSIQNRVPIKQLAQQQKSAEDDEYVILESYKTDIVKPLKRLSGLNLSHSPTTQSPPQQKETASKMSYESRSIGKVSIELTDSDLEGQLDDCLGQVRRQIHRLDEHTKSTAVELMDDMQRRINRVMTVFELFKEDADPIVLFRIGALLCAMLLQSIEDLQRTTISMKRHMRPIYALHVSILYNVEQSMQALHQMDINGDTPLQVYCDYLFFKAIHLYRENKYHQTAHLCEAMLLFPDPMAFLLQSDLSLPIKQYFKAYEASIIDLITLTNKQMRPLTHFQ